MALGTSLVRPGDWLWNVMGSDSKTGKKFEKPYRYINRGFPPGTGGWPYLTTISVPNYRMTPADTSDPNDRSTPSSVTALAVFAVLIIHANVRAPGFRLNSCYRLYQQSTATHFQGLFSQSTERLNGPFLLNKYYIVLVLR